MCSICAINRFELINNKLFIKSQARNYYYFFIFFVRKSNHNESNETLLSINYCQLVVCQYFLKHAVLRSLPTEFRGLKIFNVLDRILEVMSML